jgi:YHS domain-containing protein
MSHQHTKEHTEREQVLDPVCGMEADPEATELHFRSNGTTYFFCSPSCYEKFKEHPDEYLKHEDLYPHEHEKQAKEAGSGRSLACPMHPEVRKEWPKWPECGMWLEEEKASPIEERAHKVHAAPKAGGYTCPMHPEVISDKPDSCPKCGMALEPVVGAGPFEKTEYVCPMHPEVVSGEPGSCPKCGMALEPRTFSAEDEENPELVSMTRRFWVSLCLDHSGICQGHGEVYSRKPDFRLVFGSGSRRGGACPCNDGGPLGRLAVFCSGRTLGHHHEPQHVHSYRSRCQCLLRIQRGGGPCSWNISNLRFAVRRAGWISISKRRP